MVDFVQLKKQQNGVYHKYQKVCYTFNQSIIFIYTVQSSSTGEGDEDKAVLRPALERPLPWFIFLPALVSLRIFRVGLTIGALLMGKDPVGPSTVVRFLQTRRRKLRALKYNGLRSIRTRNVDKNTDGNKQGFVTNIYKLICGLACSTDAIPEDGIQMIVGKSKKNKSEVCTYS